MESLLFALRAVMPIILTVAVGYMLKRTGLMTEQFSLAANKLVFRVFLPCMLFLGVYKIGTIEGLGFGFILYAVIAEIAVIALSALIIAFLPASKGKKGVVLQAAFRSNYALIGIPLAGALAGDEGVAVASLLSVVFVPMINVTAVIVLSVYGQGDKRPKVSDILLGIIKNPLIIGVIIGVAMLAVRSVFTSYGIGFRFSDIDVVYSLIESLSSLATPMALLVLGARFEFSAVSELKREILLGSFLRTCFAPLIGIGIAALFMCSYFSSAHFAAFVCAFATPVAVSSVPMAQEMGGDSRLAGQLVVWTTISSAFTLFAISFILKSVGIFV